MSANLTRNRRPTQNRKKFKVYFCDPEGIFDIESLSISLNVKSSLCFNDSPVQLTGTKTAKAKTVMGTNIFSLHNHKSLQIK